MKMSSKYFKGILRCRDTFNMLNCRPENLDKIERRSNAYIFTKIAEMRPGKKLLVLDIDYTIFGKYESAQTGILLVSDII